MLRVVHHSSCRDKHNCPQYYLNLGPLTVQSNVLTTRPAVLTLLFAVQSIAACRKGTNNKYEFKFDCVFPPHASQAEVFEEISQLVQVQHTKCFLLACMLAFSALTRLGDKKGIRLVKKMSGEVLTWLSVWRECRLAYGPADATATHCVLLQ